MEMLPIHGGAPRVPSLNGMGGEEEVVRWYARRASVGVGCEMDSGAFNMWTVTQQFSQIELLPDVVVIRSVG